jgi:superfamily II DNA or RNA helicase
VVEVMGRDRKTNGDWARPRPARLAIAAVRTLPPGEDRLILERLLGGRPHYEWNTAYPDPGEVARTRIDGVLVGDLLPAMCATGRCVARVRDAAPPAPDEGPGPSGGFGGGASGGVTRGWRERAPKPRPAFLPLAWDAGEPWRFIASITRDEPSSAYVITGALERGAERLPLAEPILAVSDLVVTRTHAAPLDHRGAPRWLAALRAYGSISVPFDARPDLVNTLLAEAPPLDHAPEELRLTIEDGTPRPWLRLSPNSIYGAHRFEAELIVDYDGFRIPVSTPQQLITSPDATRFIRRDLVAERRLLDTLHQAGFRDDWSPSARGRVPHIAAHLLPRVVRALLGQGWMVDAAGVTYRQSSSVSMHVSSGIDWFELHAEIDYGGPRASLPELLAAVQRGDGFVALDDGTMGLLPEEWLRRHELLSRLGVPEGGRLRFRSSQAALLDALLASQPDATCDDVFARARHELASFDGIVAVDPPDGFVGTLRPYQREGLGWLLFLQRFGFGGCLADDMGLGKTVMVLALLARIHEERQPDRASRPSLVVAPRSLVFNWRREAERFAPALRVLDYTGSGRAASRAQFGAHDIVLTTYGTLRRDAAHLAAIPFQYVVLDEAQAIKNASSAAAKATRLLTSSHRLALSGTPIENHLGELWSLFEFLNPGVLGTSTAFERAGSRGLDDEAVAILARGLRPFILRRTKAQVARDLPEKTEQTIYCELERPQRALYDQLRDHYRQALLERADTARPGNAKLQILEALLRLRQAACHPGLIDTARRQDPSAKLDVLLPRLIEAIDEGHKTLVFSQFTSLLSILRARLDASGLIYEYLDGRTRDRQARVDRFQTDPACRLFLISLKAGGLGLNLTAAEYVFLLDPWWNPAAEAQAIDRAHRIGQARHVFAYRLIAKDTVEERVLELQRKKQTLADAILTADTSLIRTLRREDLELLLS